MKLKSLKPIRRYVRIHVADLAPIKAAARRHHRTIARYLVACALTECQTKSLG